MSEPNIQFELNIDDLDTSLFWKSRDESTKITMNEKLNKIARNGPCSEFVSTLKQESSAGLDKDYEFLIDLDIVDSSGWSPLLHASFNGHLAIVEHIISHQQRKYLSEYGDELMLLTETEDQDQDIGNDANYNIVGTQPEEINDDETFSELKWKYLFRKFLRRKVKWNGSTALHLACARGHELIVNFLINTMLNEYDMSAAESIDSIDYDMATPLHCAVLGKHYNICKLLLSKGCSVNKSDIGGKTALDWATGRGLNQYVSLLASYAKKEKEKAAVLTVENIQIAEREREKVVESIWEQNQESKSMEADNEIINVGPNQNHQPNRQMHDNYSYTQQTGLWHHGHSHHAGVPYYNYPHIPPHGAPPPPPHTLQTHGAPPPHGAHSRVQTMSFRAHHSHHNTHHNTHHNNHHSYRQRAPRHQRYFNQNHHNQQNQPNCSSVSICPPSYPQPLLVASKSCPAGADKQSEQIVQSEIDQENAVDVTENEEIVEKNKIDDPAFDAMKFQNKYLKARCDTLEKEHKELATEYKQQLMKENNRWRLREEKLLQQLDTKQKQIHELRHTLRRMRMFLDNLPVKMRRNFYRNNGNFSRELFENQQITNHSQASDNSLSSENNQNNYKMVMKEVDDQASNVTTNGWRTVVTADLNGYEQDENDKENDKQPQQSQPVPQQTKQNNKSNKSKKNKKNKNNKNNRFNDTFLFYKLTSNAARSRKCAMSDKSWRRKKKK